MGEENLADLATKLRVLIKNRENEFNCDIECLDDAILNKFIRSCDYDVNYTCQVLINYFNCRLRHPETFTFSESARKVLKSNIFVLCDKPNEKFNNERILYFRVGNWNEEETTAADIACAAAHLIEYELIDEESQKHGVIQLEVFTERATESRLKFLLAVPL